MTTFHEGQEVEVAADFRRNDGKAPCNWRKAKIAAPPWPAKWRYRVQFPDGTRAVFDADHIREVDDEKF